MNILITGAGSVMGQSIYKALTYTQFDAALNIHFANSEPLGAGRFFSHPRFPVIATPIFPLARDALYTDFLQEYVNTHEIDLVFTGTQHELLKISQFRDKTLKAATLPEKIVDMCIDKVKTAELLKPYGIRVPKTQILKHYLEAPNIDGPVILKPNQSSSSRSIFRFNHHNAVHQACKTMQIDPDSFLVQARLEGEEYTCGCYIDRYSKNITQISFKRTLTQDGATAYGEIDHQDEIKAYITNIAKALIDLGLDFGHINVQLIHDSVSPCLFEINGRLSSTEASKAHYGFNACAAFIQNIVYQKPFDSWRVPSTGRFLRYYEEVYF